MVVAIRKTANHSSVLVQILANSLRCGTCRNQSKILATFAPTCLTLQNTERMEFSKPSTGIQFLKPILNDILQLNTTTTPSEFQSSIYHFRIGWIRLTLSTGWTSCIASNFHFCHFFTNQPCFLFLNDVALKKWHQGAYLDFS